MHVPFADLKLQYAALKPAIDGAIAAVIEQTAFVGGRFVAEFEQGFAKAYGVSNVVPCANGTDALYIVLKMLGVGPGDEVITVANTWISSAETIVQAGARPVFVDVHPEFYSIDERLIEERITPRTRALIAVHLQGQMCDIVRIKEICDRSGVHLIEDCAQAHYSEAGGKRAGLHGIAGTFSFYPGKNLGAYGDAGCIVTADDDLARRCRMFANHGALEKHRHQMPGVNSRLDGLQAAILSAKLPHVHAWTEARIRTAALYNRYLADTPEVVTPRVRPGTRHTFHLYVIRTERRDELAAWLRARGIETAIHYPTALPNMPAFSSLGYQPGDFPVATALQGTILSLPMFSEITEEQVRYVCGSIHEFFATAEREGKTA